MAGIPEADLAEWQARKGRGNNSNSSNGPPPSKKPKVESVALTPEQLKAQLEAHKALMNGGSSSSNPEASTSSSSIPPPAFNPGVPGAPSGPSQRISYQQPPPNVGYGGYNQPPPQQYNAPPPGFGMPPRPNYPVGPPPSSNPAFGGYPSGPPPLPPQAASLGNSFAAPPYQGGPRQWGPPPSNPNGPMYSGPPPSIPQPQYSPHQIAVRTGAKSRMVYTDKEISPEEKLASMGKYRYVDPDDGPLNSVQAQASNQYPSSFQGPPPSSSYPQQHNGPPPSNQWPQRQSSTSSASPAPPSNSSFPPQGSPQTQSYPAIAPGALPPSQQPQANTAEALAQANANASQTSSMANGMANGNGIQERESDVRQMVEGAREEEYKGDVKSVDQKMASGGGSKVGGNEGEAAATKGRKRAADLF